MKTTHALVLFLLLPFASAAPILDLVAQASSLTGKEYLAVRARALALGTNAVSVLRDIANAPDRSWQERLVAEIWSERLIQSSVIEALIMKDWALDSEYRREWDAPISGPAGGFTELKNRRLKEANCPYYLIEAYWKETGEFGRVGNWKLNLRALGLPVVEEMPTLRPFLVEIYEEDLRNDPELHGRPRELPRNQTSKGDYAYRTLVKWKSRRSLPLLLQRLNHKPYGFPYGFAEDIVPMLVPGDIPLLQPYAVKQERVQRAIQDLQFQ